MIVLTTFVQAVGTACAADAPLPAATAQTLAEQVRKTEFAFAKTMADRDFGNFSAFISPEAIFFSGEKALRGKADVTAAWKGFFQGKQAPFSWRPDKVEVLESGALALSSGPVHDPSGKLIGSFTSIWRRESSGSWRIVFDKGCDVCAACKQ